MFGREGLVILHILKAKYLYHPFQEGRRAPTCSVVSMQGIADAI